MKTYFLCLQEVWFVIRQSLQQVRVEAQVYSNASRQPGKMSSFIVCHHWQNTLPVLNDRGELSNIVKHETNKHEIDKHDITKI